MGGGCRPAKDTVGGRVRPPPRDKRVRKPCHHPATSVRRRKRRAGAPTEPAAPLLAAPHQRGCGRLPTSNTATFSERNSVSSS